MKRTYFIMICFIFLITGMYAQAPQAFKYQVVVRDENGELIANQPVAFRISILQGGTEGAMVYRERHTITTNNWGLANLEIGNGTVLNGIFADIDWASGLLFIKTEFDPDGGNLYLEMGTSQLLSVPYALYAEKGGALNSLEDNDGDTKVQVEEIPDEDKIRFDLGGQEKMVLTDSRLELVNPKNNILVGKNAGYLNTTGTSNVAIGNGTLYNSTLQSQLVAIGDSALYKNGIGAFSDLATGNTAIGAKSLFSNTYGRFNTAVGFHSLYSNIYGAFNTANGFRALFNSTGGFDNSAFGYEAMYSNIDGEGNTVMGTKALHDNSTGGQNTAIGYMALNKNSSGSGNVAIGFGAGYYETGDDKLYIDNYFRGSEETARNNALIYGVFHTLPTNQRLTINGKVGIMTNDFSYDFHVNGSAKIEGPAYVQGSLYVNGWSHFNSNLEVNGWTRTKVLEITGTGGSDLAEPFEISGSEEILPGSVVVIDETNPGALKLSTKAYDPLVAGVISGAGGLQPGITLGPAEQKDNTQKVALSGRVYVLATTENGPIKPGDLLTTSDTPGCAMRATDLTRCSGAVIGKAMSKLELEKEIGIVLILINFQ